MRCFLIAHPGQKQKDTVTPPGTAARNAGRPVCEVAEAQANIEGVTKGCQTQKTETSLQPRLTFG
jgi:hypothetical protein